MASTLFFCFDNGATLGTEARGTTSSTGIGNISLMNADSNAGNYGTNTIAAGSNSYDKFLFLMWSGSFNNVNSVRFNHVSGNLGAGLQFLFGTGSSGFYRSPASTANSALTFALTSTGLLSTGIGPIQIGTGSPNIFAGKASSSTNSPTFSSFIGGQLQTTISASAGDASPIPYVFGVSWLES